MVGDIFGLPNLEYTSLFATPAYISSDCLEDPDLLITNADTISEILS